MLSLKNDIDMVKEELNSEEKFFEKAVITERFVKKYKNLMIGSLVVVVAVVGANIAYDLNKQSQIESANKALVELTNDSTNSKALADLKVSSPSLYDVWLFSKAIADNDMASLKELKSSNTLLVGDLSTYELAQNSKDAKALNDYSSKQASIYRDLAKVQNAVILLNEHKIDQAHQKLSSITEESSLYKIAEALLHYGVK